MNTTTRLMFDVTPESEKRFTMKVAAFKNALQGGQIKIYKILKIKQRWIMNGDKYTGRIRETTYIMPANKQKDKPLYEHTVKHHVKKGVDYEITTDIEKHDYDLLDNLYKDEKLQVKERYYVVDKINSSFYDKYIITVDIPEDQPEICWVEFETNVANIDKQNFKKPSWVQEIKE